MHQTPKILASSTTKAGVSNYLGLKEPRNRSVDSHQSSRGPVMQTINEKIKTNKKQNQRDRTSNKRNFASLSPRNTFDNSNLTKNEYISSLKFPDQ